MGYNHKESSGSDEPENISNFIGPLMINDSIPEAMFNQKEDEFKNLVPSSPKKAHIGHAVQSVGHTVPPRPPTADPTKQQARELKSQYDSLKKGDLIAEKNPLHQPKLHAASQAVGKHNNKPDAANSSSRTFKAVPQVDLKIAPENSDLVYVLSVCDPLPSYHSKDNFRKTVQSYIKDKRTVTFVVTDTLQYENYLYKLICEKQLEKEILDSGKIPLELKQEALRLAIEAGQKWLAEVKDVLEEIKIPWTVVYWDEVETSEQFAAEEKILNQLRTSNESAKFVTPHMGEVETNMANAIELSLEPTLTNRYKFPNEIDFITTTSSDDKSIHGKKSDVKEKVSPQLPANAEVKKRKEFARDILKGYVINETNGEAALGEVDHPVTAWTQGKKLSPAEPKTTIRKIDPLTGKIDELPLPENAKLRKRFPIPEMKENPKAERILVYPTVLNLAMYAYRALHPNHDKKFLPHQYFIPPQAPKGIKKKQFSRPTSAASKKAMNAVEKKQQWRVKQTPPLVSKEPQFEESQVHAQQRKDVKGDKVSQILKKSEQKPENKNQSLESATVGQFEKALKQRFDKAKKLKREERNKLADSVEKMLQDLRSETPASSPALNLARGQKKHVHTAKSPAFFQRGINSPRLATPIRNTPQLVQRPQPQYLRRLSTPCATTPPPKERWVPVVKPKDPLNGQQTPVAALLSPPFLQKSGDANVTSLLSNQVQPNQAQQETKQSSQIKVPIPFKS